MNAPSFIVHASGSLGGVPDQGKRAYRLRFAVITDPFPSREEVKRGLRRSFDALAQGMALHGFRFAGEETVRFEEKRPHMETVEVHVHRPPTSRQMLPGVMQGNRFRATDEPAVMAVPLLESADAWEFIFSGVFVRDAIIADIPAPHEEKRPS